MEIFGSLSSLDIVKIDSLVLLLSNVCQTPHQHVSHLVDSDRLLELIRQ